jgi:hypothetical protein
MARNDGYNGGEGIRGKCRLHAFNHCAYHAILSIIYIDLGRTSICPSTFFKRKEWKPLSYKEKGRKSPTSLCPYVHMHPSVCIHAYGHVYGH